MTDTTPAVPGAVERLIHGMPFAERDQAFARAHDAEDAEHEANTMTLLHGMSRQGIENAALRYALRQCEEALVQTKGALLLDAMVDDKGKLFGTTTVALVAADAALARVRALTEEGR